MRKIEKRGVFCLILAALLGIGLAFFCFRFVADGGDWASYPITAICTPTRACSRAAPSSTGTATCSPP